MAKNQQTSVIIIGAGIAGIAAAHHLRKSGIKNILILEAANRIGGRIWTDRRLKYPVELGASWIHGANTKNPITSIARKAKAETTCLSMDRFQLYDDHGKIYDYEQLKKSAKAFHKLLKKIEKKGKRNKSVLQLINEIAPKSFKDPLIHYLLSANLEFDLGGDINRLSSKYFYDDDEFAGEDVYISNGYQHIVKYLAQKLPYKLNTKVKNIDYSQNRVIVGTSDKKYIADKLILTVPLGVLQYGNIKFRPELPSKKLRSIHRLGMGTVNKIVLVFDHIFWEKKIEHFGISSSKKGAYNYFINLYRINGQKALMTFAFGSFAQKMEKQSDKEVKKDILQQLRKIYGKKVPKPTAFYRTKWASDPLFRGAYSFASVNSVPKDFDRIATPIKEQVYFAGEHTNHKYRGTVHGAYLSGQKAANLLIQSTQALS